MQCIRSPPAPEAAFWGRCSGFCRTEIQEVTESFLMHLRQEHGFDLTKPYLSKTKATSSHTLFEQQNTTVALRRKTVLFFFYFFFLLWENYFQGQKAFAYCLWGKEIQHLELAFVISWRSLWNLSAWESLSLESKDGLRPSFTAISAVLWGSAKWRTTTDIFEIDRYIERYIYIYIYECFKV